MPIKRFLDKAILYSSGTLAIPTLLILITWNTLPGQALYPIKRGLEGAALIILSPSLEAKTSLQAGLIERRTNEATTLIASDNTTQGLVLLEAQVESATIETQKAKTPEQQIKINQKLITQLKQTNQQLEEVKVSTPTQPATNHPYTPPTTTTTTTNIYNPTTSPYQYPTSTPTITTPTTTPYNQAPTTQPTTTPPQPLPTTPTPENEASLEQTQALIEETITQLESQIQEAEIETNRSRGKKQDDDNHQQQEKEENEREDRPEKKYYN